MSRKMKICMIAVMLFVCAAMAAAFAENYATSGNGSDSTCFFVISNGNASVKLRQTEGMCHELSYTHLIDGIQGDEEEWGKYHIYVSTPNGSTYVEDWDKTFNGDSYTVYLSGTGTYLILVVPYTAGEMTESWTLDKFLGWTTEPYWWVDETSNCYTQTSLTASIYVQQIDSDTGAVLSSRTETVKNGNNTVYAGSAPAEYDLISKSGINVYVDNNGRPDQNSIAFYYQRKAPASATVTVYCYDTDGNYLKSYTETITSSERIYPHSINGYYSPNSSEYISFSNGNCSPSSVNFYYQPYTPSSGSSGSSTGGQLVQPYTWDTQFRSGTTGPETYNENRYKKLGNLWDDDYRTSFDWLIWNSERHDDIPELTAYFSNATVSSIRIRNGFLKNANDYYQYARASGLTIRVYDSYGGCCSTSISIPDEYTTNYRQFSLGGTYANVSRIEIWLDSFNYNKSADSDHKYVIHIADVQFY